jgi:hypothetical protein
VGSLPTFSAAKGIAVHIQYCRLVLVFYNNNFQKLSRDRECQYLLLTASFRGDTPAHFLALHARELAQICPSSATQLLRASAGLSSASSFAMYRDDASERSSAYTSGGQTQPLLAEYRALLSQTADASSAAAKGPLADPGEGTVPLIIGWLRLCERRLAAPQPGELAEWNERMTMGRENSLDPHVKADEGPHQFSVRVLETFAIFVTHAAAQFAAQSQKQPLEVFLAGIPATYRARVTAHMNLVSLTDLTPMQRLHQTARAAQALHENEPGLRGASGAQAGLPPPRAGQEITAWQPRRDRSAVAPGTYPIAQPPRNMRKPHHTWYAEEQGRAVAAALATAASVGAPASGRPADLPGVKPRNATYASGQDARAQQPYRDPPPRGIGGAPGTGAPSQEYKGCWGCGAMDHSLRNCPNPQRDRMEAINRARAPPTKQPAPAAGALRLNPAPALLRIEGTPRAALSTHAALPTHLEEGGPGQGGQAPAAAAAVASRAHDRDPEEEQAQRFYSGCSAAVFHSHCTLCEPTQLVALATSGGGADRARESTYLGRTVFPVGHRPALAAAPRQAPAGAPDRATPPRPRSFTATPANPPPTLAQYQRALAAGNKLVYAAQPRNSPERCIGLRAVGVGSLC